MAPTSPTLLTSIRGSDRLTSRFGISPSISSRCATRWTECTRSFRFSSAPALWSCEAACRRMTPDGHFLIDRLPGVAGFYVAAAATWAGYGLRHPASPARSDPASGASRPCARNPRATSSRDGLADVVSEAGRGSFDTSARESPVSRRGSSGNPPAGSSAHAGYCIVRFRRRGNTSLP